MLNYSPHRKAISLLILCLILTVCLSACGNKQTDVPAQSSAQDAYTFTDALGQEITVDHPQRVVSLMAVSPKFGY